jgi:SAM-dependent methyltransferase
MSVRRTPPVRRRESFDSVADLYDTYRQRYPDHLVDAIIRFGRLDPGSRVLEIGCGTGQLSVALARRGVQLLAIELGPNLASRARQNLERFSNARVEVGAFEQWQLPCTDFDAVVAANALHWIDPPARFCKSAEALRTGGALVIVHWHHVRGGTPGLLSDTQPLYLKWGLSDDPSFGPPAPADLLPAYQELEQLSEFSSVERHRFEELSTFSTDAYVGLLRTDSLVLGLDETSRRGFLDDMATLIESAYGGEVSRNQVYEVIAARR